MRSKKQTKFLFIYDKNISVDRTASVQVREQPVAEALAQMLAGTDLTYEINSSNIILSKRSADAAASSSLHNVAGVVLDAHGQPIIGASVVIKGTTIGISMMSTAVSDCRFPLR
ncbi:MAG: secretin and TonB N-terminal domain-containing protein [Alistipes finegoldii]